MRVAESWKIGHEGLDNGVIVIVAQQDRRARIEVGYGLEGTIPDAIAARILREHMIPHFRAGEMDAGIEAGVDALMAAARGEEIPLEQRPFRGGSAVAPDDLPRLLFAVFLGAGIGGVFRRTRTLRVAASAGVAGLLGLFLLEAIPWAGLAALLGGALGLFAPIGPLSGGRRTGGGGWVGGSSGGFGGGGFSGGGGSFGGGGASGSW
jgi:uncharacterized protein